MKNKYYVVLHVKYQKESPRPKYHRHCEKCISRKVELVEFQSFFLQFSNEKLNPTPFKELNRPWLISFEKCNLNFPANRTS